MINTTTVYCTCILYTCITLCDDNFIHIIGEAVFSQGLFSATSKFTSITQVTILNNSFNDV